MATDHLGGLLPTEREDRMVHVEVQLERLELGF